MAGWGSRTFGLVLVDLDAPGEQLPGERSGAGEHPGLPGHLVLLHRDLNRVHGWHERHGLPAAAALAPPAGLQPSQGGEPAAQSQAAGRPPWPSPAQPLPRRPSGPAAGLDPSAPHEAPLQRLKLNECVERPALLTVAAAAGTGGSMPARPGPCVLSPSHLQRPSVELVLIYVRRKNG